MDYTLESVLDQLGIEDEQALREMCAGNGKLSSATSLADAEFWSESQSAFLRESIASDGPWSPAVGQLDALIRSFQQ